jgi:hypothetical protein
MRKGARRRAPPPFRRTREEIDESTAAAGPQSAGKLLNKDHASLAAVFDIS